MEKVSLLLQPCLKSLNVKLKLSELNLIYSNGIVKGGGLVQYTKFFVHCTFSSCAEEVGQLSREFLDQSNRAIFYASWLRFLSRKFTQDGKNL